MLTLHGKIIPEAKLDFMEFLESAVMKGLLLEHNPGTKKVF